MKNDRDEQLHANHAHCRHVGRARNHAWWTIIIYNHRETVSSAHKTKSLFGRSVIITDMENVGYNLDIAGLIWCRWRRKRRFRLAVFARGDDRRVVVVQFAVNRHGLLISLSGGRRYFFLNNIPFHRTRGALLVVTDGDEGRRLRRRWQRRRGNKTYISL